MSDKLYHNGHCDPQCPHLHKHGQYNPSGAHCDLMLCELEWYDYWLAVCDDQCTPQYLTKLQRRRIRLVRKLEKNHAR